MVYAGNEQAKLQESESNFCFKSRICHIAISITDLNDGIFADIAIAFDCFLHFLITATMRR
jgi:hypothetical protein